MNLYGLLHRLYFNDMRKTSLLLILLGNLASFGPFVTDFYLPSLPSLSTVFSVPAAVIQMSLTASMLGLAVGQLFIGPISDKYGRRAPLVWSLLLFVAATAGCIAATSAEWFIFFRLMQGLTGAGGLVISKVVVTDRFTGSESAKYFAILAAVQFIAPIIAPVLGGAVLSLTSWQGIFVVLGIWGIILLWGSWRMEESLPRQNRLDIPVLKSFGCFVSVVRNRRFIIMTLLLAFVSAVVFSYISASAFLFQEHFGLSPMLYSVCFACNALGLVAGSGVVMKVRNQKAILRCGIYGLIVTGLLTACALVQAWPFVVFEALLMLMILCCGALIPLTTTLALNTVTDNKGAAAALLGSLSFLAGGIVAPLVGIGSLTHSTAVLFVTGAAVSLLLYWWSCRFDYSLGE